MSKLLLSTLGNLAKTVLKSAEQAGYTATQYDTFTTALRRSDIIIFPVGTFDVKSDVVIGAEKVIYLLPGATLNISSGKKIIVKGTLFTQSNSYYTGGGTITSQGGNIINLLAENEISIHNIVTHVGSPVGNLTPDIVDQLCLNVTNGSLYLSTGLANTNWTLIPSSSSYNIPSGSELPTAATGNRNTLFSIPGGEGVADKLFWCYKTAEDTYDWEQIG